MEGLGLMEEPLSHAGLGIAICSHKHGVNTATKPALSLVVGPDEQRVPGVFIRCCTAFGGSTLLRERIFTAILCGSGYFRRGSGNASPADVWTPSQPLVTCPVCRSRDLHGVGSLLDGEALQDHPLGERSRLAAGGIGGKRWV